MEEILKELRLLSARLERIENLVGTRLTQEQARKCLGISRHTIMKYRDQGILSPHREGKRIYYRLSDLEKLLD